MAGRLPRFSTIDVPAHAIAEVCRRARPLADR
jgi:hypothetical protein